MITNTTITPSNNMDNEIGTTNKSNFDIENKNSNIISVNHMNIVRFLKTIFSTLSNGLFLS